MKIKITQGFTRNLVVIGFLLGCTLLAIAYARQKTDPLSQMPGTEFDPQARNQQCRNPLVGNLFAKTELFFGLSKSNGSEVSNQEFQDFVNTQVSRRFPDGLFFRVQVSLKTTAARSFVRNPSYSFCSTLSTPKATEKLKKFGIPTNPNFSNSRYCGLMKTPVCPSDGDGNRGLHICPSGCSPSTS
jgi:hypothetical protein